MGFPSFEGPSPSQKLFSLEPKQNILDLSMNDDRASAETLTEACGDQYRYQQSRIGPICVCLLMSVYVSVCMHLGINACMHVIRYTIIMHVAVCRLI